MAPKSPRTVSGGTLCNQLLTLGIGDWFKRTLSLWHNVYNMCGLLWSTRSPIHPISQYTVSMNLCHAGSSITMAILYNKHYNILCNLSMEEWYFPLHNSAHTVLLILAPFAPSAHHAVQSGPVIDSSHWLVSGGFTIPVSNRQGRESQTSHKARCLEWWRIQYD